MSHTDKEIESAAARVEDWANTLDPAAFRDVTDLRAVAEAANAVKTAEAQLREAVQVAHVMHGRSWAQIGIALGVSRQAARERWASKVERTAHEQELHA